MRIPNYKMLAFNLLLTINLRIFWKFSTNQIMSILSNTFFIFVFNRFFLNLVKHYLAFIHPLLVFYFLKEMRHYSLKLLKSGEFFSFLNKINTLHKVIEDLHNQIVVVLVFTIHKHNFRKEKVVIFEGIKTINLSNFLL